MSVLTPPVQPFHPVCVNKRTEDRRTKAYTVAGLDDRFTRQFKVRGSRGARIARTLADLMNQAYRKGNQAGKQGLPKSPGRPKPDRMIEAPKRK